MSTSDYSSVSTLSSFNGDFDSSSRADSAETLSRSSSTIESDQDAWSIEERLDAKEDLLRSSRVERLEILSRLLKLEDDVGRRLAVQRIATKLSPAANDPTYDTSDTASQTDTRSVASVLTTEEISIYWNALAVDVERLKIPIRRDDTFGTPVMVNRQDGPVANTKLRRSQTLPQ